MANHAMSISEANAVPPHRGGNSAPIMVCAKTGRDVTRRRRGADRPHGWPAGGTSANAEPTPHEQTQGRAAERKSKRGAGGALVSGALRKHRATPSKEEGCLERRQQQWKQKWSDKAPMHNERTMIAEPEEAARRENQCADTSTRHQSHTYANCAHPGYNTIDNPLPFPPKWAQGRSGRRTDETPKDPETPDALIVRNAIPVHLGLCSPRHDRHVKPTHGKGFLCAQTRRPVCEHQPVPQPLPRQSTNQRCDGRQGGAPHTSARARASGAASQLRRRQSSGARGEKQRRRAPRSYRAP